jgi:phosphoenolpyruvate---glycerone phosphotransferase subunit DhaL
MTEDTAAETILPFDRAAQRRLFEALVAAVLANAPELTDLDRAIGDGDHGINLARGFKAVALQLDALTELPIGPALKELGKRLVMSVGGASGPLYGTLFMALGDQLSGDAPLSRRHVTDACSAAVAAVRARGKSEAGQKTMLDVLLPVASELTAAGDNVLERLVERAAGAARATVPMRAQRGRAAFLGERSVGHMDPGARSSQLLIAAACASLRERQ